VRLSRVVQVSSPIWHSMVSHQFSLSESYLPPPALGVHGLLYLHLRSSVVTQKHTMWMPVFCFVLFYLPLNMGYLNVLVLYWYSMVGKIPRSDSSLVRRVQDLRGQTYTIILTVSAIQTSEIKVSDDGTSLQGSCKLRHTLLIIGILVQICSTKNLCSSGNHDSHAGS
jgi:hypothetical protein